MEYDFALLLAEIAAASPAEPAHAELIAELDGYLSALYPPEQNHLLSVEALLQPEATFVVARAEGSVLGCGAIVRRILWYLEELGRNEGFALARLETGIRQPEALRFYGRAGYRPIPAFGVYAPSDLSVFMERVL